MITYTMGGVIDDPCGGCQGCPDDSGLASSYLMSWPASPGGAFPAGSTTIYQQSQSFLAGSGLCQVYLDTNGGYATFTDLLNSRADDYPIRLLTQDSSGTWVMSVDNYQHHCCLAGAGGTISNPVGTYVLDGTEGIGCCTSPDSDGLTGSIS